MNRIAATLAAAALLAGAGCRMENGRSYVPQGDPWAAPPADGAEETARGADEEPAPAAAASDEAAVAAAKSARPAPSPRRGGESTTTLEQLDAARKRVTELEASNAKLASELAALTTLADTLKKENGNLNQMLQSEVAARGGADEAVAKAQAAAKELEVRCRTLADDLLAERIQRVRVERELVLAKVAEAERRDDGN